MPQSQWHIAMALVLVAQLFSSQALAQSQCALRLRTASAEIETAVTVRDQPLFRVPLFGMLDSVTRDWAQQFRHAQAYYSARLASPTSGLDSLMRNLGPPAIRDTVFLSGAAIVLAGIMQGEPGGFSEDQAWLASWLYDRLGLPSGKAAQLLLSPTTDGQALNRALIALSARTGEPRVANAMVARVCLLAARANATASLLPMDHRVLNIGDLLTRSETDALSTLLLTLSRVSQAPGSTRLRLRALLDQDNPVALLVQQTRPELW